MKLINENLNKFYFFALTGSLFLLPASGWSHGTAGKRFFPSTIATEDPFVNDEFSFVTGYIKAPDEDGAMNRTTNIETEYTK